jgi:hypothetical protein
MLTRKMQLSITRHSGQGLNGNIPANSEDVDVSKADRNNWDPELMAHRYGFTRLVLPELRERLSHLSKLW